MIINPISDKSGSVEILPLPITQNGYAACFDMVPTCETATEQTLANEMVVKLI